MILIVFSIVRDLLVQSDKTRLIDNSFFNRLLICSRNQIMENLFFNHEESNPIRRHHWSFFVIRCESLKIADNSW